MWSVLLGFIGAHTHRTLALNASLVIIFKWEFALILALMQCVYTIHMYSAQRMNEWMLPLPHRNSKVHFSFNFRCLVRVFFFLRVLARLHVAQAPSSLLRLAKRNKYFSVISWQTAFRLSIKPFISCGKRIFQIQKGKLVCFGSKVFACHLTKGKLSSLKWNENTKVFSWRSGDASFVVGKFANKKKSNHSVQNEKYTIFHGEFGRLTMFKLRYDIAHQRRSMANVFDSFQLFVFSRKNQKSH